MRKQYKEIHKGRSRQHLNYWSLETVWFYKRDGKCRLWKGNEFVNLQERRGKVNRNQEKIKFHPVGEMKNPKFREL